MGFLQTYPKKGKKVYFTKKISDFDHLEEGRIKVEYLGTAEKTVDFFVHKMNVTKVGVAFVLMLVIIGHKFDSMHVA